MNKQELIIELKAIFHAVDEAGIHEGNTEAGITLVLNGLLWLERYGSKINGIHF